MNDTRFESCIKCTVCTTTCPVSRVNPRYPGPKQAGPDGERLRLKDGALYDEALKYCINCKRCEVACPSDVKIGDIIQRARAQYGQQKADPARRHPQPYRPDGYPFHPLCPPGQRATGLKPVRRLLDATLNIDHRAYAAEIWFRHLPPRLPPARRPSEAVQRTGGFLSWLLRQL
ncbi:anaerobic glycerol-3-phosphate dehydrogenase subunit C [Klebsiella pneumoniae]|nr:anaerobic glycerol-3-phosphate dehydrogenase subunit C [Klebsiella pneumoniae]